MVWYGTISKLSYNHFGGEHLFLDFIKIKGCSPKVCNRWQHVSTTSKIEVNYISDNQELKDAQLRRMHVTCRNAYKLSKV